MSDISLCESCLHPCKMYMALFGSFGATRKSKIFHNIELKIWILASPYGEAGQIEKRFACHRGLFEYTVMPFGLCRMGMVGFLQ